jgi:transposase-like protein
MTNFHDDMMKAPWRGRPRYTAEQKQGLLEAYEASGLSCARFASLHGVGYQSAPRRSTAYPFMGVIPVSEGNAEAQSSQRDAEGERGEF